jgi:CRP/FNR family transcriptional regulator, cyclic AMP receptor protein
MELWEEVRVSSSDAEPRAWFRLTAAEQAALMAAGYTKVWPAGDTIAPQGGPPTSMYVILTGWVKITVSNDRGDNAPLAARGPGEIIGELAPITDAPRAAAIQAITPVHALVIPRDRVRAVIHHHPHIAEELLRTTAIRLQQSDRMRLESGGSDFTQRLAAVLLELADQCSPNSPDNKPVDLPFPQEELASFARVSRSTLIRGLEELRKLQLIQTSRRRTTIPRLQPLRDYATGKAESL